MPKKKNSNEPSTEFDTDAFFSDELAPNKRKSDVPSNWVPILAAVIGAAAVIIVGYWQYSKKDSERTQNVKIEGDRNTVNQTINDVPPVVTERMKKMANDSLLSSAEKDELYGVKEALDGHANVNAYNGRGLTAMMLASFGKEEIIDMGNNEKYITRIPQPKIARLLMEKGADVNAKSKESGVNNGFTALMYASSGLCAFDFDRQFKSISMLGESSLPGASKKPDPMQESLRKVFEDLALLNPITQAVKLKNNNSLEVIKSLCAKGADINATDSQGNTALMLACKCNLGFASPIPPSLPGSLASTGMFSLDKQIVTEFINRQAGTDTRNKDGKTVLMLARENGLREITEILIRAGAKE